MVQLLEARAGCPIWKIYTVDIQMSVITVSDFLKCAAQLSPQNIRESPESKNRQGSQKSMVGRITEVLAWMGMGNGWRKLVRGGK